MNYVQKPRIDETRKSPSPVPFALLPNGRLSDISQFESGLVEDGKCPCCGSALVAKRGSERAHHFAHYSATDCNAAVETSLHLAAKQVLVDSVLAGTPFFAPASGKSDFEKMKFPPIDMPFTEVQCEKSVFLSKKHCRPDAVGIWNAAHLAIEICVTNPVDEERKAFYEFAGLDCIEIDLGDLQKQFQMTKALNLNEIAHAVLKGRINKTWICRRGYLVYILRQEPEILKTKEFSHFGKYTLGDEAK